MTTPLAISLASIGLIGIAIGAGNLRVRSLRNDAQLPWWVRRHPYLFLGGSVLLGAAVAAALLMSLWLNILP